MRHVPLAIGITTIAFCGFLAARPIPPKQSESANKPTPMILASGEGEKREFRARPGVTFTLKIGPKNGGSETMAVVTEDMAPGDKIPTHRHPHADELILIQSGTGKVMLGDKVQVAACRCHCIHSERYLDKYGKYRDGPLDPYRHLVSIRARGVHASCFSSGWPASCPDDGTGTNGDSQEVCTLRDLSIEGLSKRPTKSQRCN